jgi:hypothetical protein
MTDHPLSSGSPIMVQFKEPLDRRLRDAAEATGKWPRDLIYEAVRRYWTRNTQSRTAGLRIQTETLPSAATLVASIDHGSGV